MILEKTHLVKKLTVGSIVLVLIAVALFAVLSTVQAEVLATISQLEISGDCFLCSAVGQSFTATATGVITTVRLQHSTEGRNTLEIYEGDGRGGQLLHSQPIALSCFSGETEEDCWDGTNVDPDPDHFIVDPQTFILTVPVPVSEGQMYSLFIMAPEDVADRSIMRLSRSDPYPGGRMWGDGWVAEHDDWDLLFEVVIEDDMPDRITPVVPDVVSNQESFEIAIDSCANASDATFTITAQSSQIYPPDSSWDNTLEESPPGSGHYTAQVPALGQLYEYRQVAHVAFSIDCGGSLEEAVVTFFIDPSGRVTDTQGNPIAGATVTLLYSPSGSQSGPFEIVPDYNAEPPSPIMSGDNINNPDETDENGFYRWDVVPGWYKVRVEKDDCGPAVESAAVQVVEGGSPVTDINLILDCGGSGLTVQITRMSDWQTGYCRSVTVTNSTAEPVDWTASFSLKRQGGGTVNQFWNTVWSQDGDLVTFEGVGWNNILQPGESTHSLGFCADR